MSNKTLNYTITVYPYGEETLTRDNDGAYIPKDERNRDYKEYLEWVADGNEATRRVIEAST